MNVYYASSNPEVGTRGSCLHDFDLLLEKNKILLQTVVTEAFDRNGRTEPIRFSDFSEASLPQQLI